jgi:nucleoside-diphosphate-sugar epimerase
MRDKVLVTGGSGFIGTNVIQALLDTNTPVLNLSPHTPMIPGHRDLHHPGDVADLDTVTDVFGKFDPSVVIHLAARTEARTANYPGEYAINFQGAETLCRVLASSTSVRTTVFTSSMVLAWPGTPQSSSYAHSKARMEQVVEEAAPMLRCASCIVRPVSTWGPYFRTPFREFFEAIARGRYWHPGPGTVPKRFGYVGNTAYQLLRLISAKPSQVDRRRFFLGDYESLTIERWANLISRSFRVKPPRMLPVSLVGVLAKAGDLFEASRIGKAPLTSRRLENMRTDTSIFPIEEIRSVAGPLPYTLEEGVEETVRWLRSTKDVRTLS